MRRLVLLALMVPFLCLAQIKEVDITADELLGGTADAVIAELAAEAVAGGLSVIVIAPQYWHELIDEQLKAGANGAPLKVEYRSTMIESVIVRLSDGQFKPRESAREPEPSPEPVAAPIAPEAPPKESRAISEVSEDLRREARDALERPTMEPTAPVPAIELDLDMDIGAMKPRKTRASDRQDSTPDPTPAGTSASETASEFVDQSIEQDPGMIEIEVAAPATLEAESTPAPSVAAQADEAPAVPEPDQMPTDGAETPEESLARRLNDGNAISKTLSVGQLRARDLLFRTDGVIAVVRASRVGRNVYLLDEPLDLDVEREEIRQLTSGKFEVLKRVSIQTPEDEIEEVTDASAPVIAAPIPEEGDALAEERTEMEARYNEGRPIESELSPAGLRLNDLLYVGDNLTVVIRRDRVALKRYWLDGNVDLDSNDFEKVGSRKYRVRTSIR